MRKPSVILVNLLLLFIIACTFKSCNNVSLKKGSTVSAKVISIIDGDTYEALLANNKRIIVRMEGIDAPEKGMSFYQNSKKHLSNLCFGKQVKIKITGIDKHERYIAYTYSDDGKELSREMIKAGLAWHFKKYNSDPELSKLELQAKTMRKGLWIEENPMSPWENRKLRRKGVSTTPRYKQIFVNNVNFADA